MNFIAHKFKYINIMLILISFNVLHCSIDLEWNE